MLEMTSGIYENSETPAKRRRKTQKKFCRPFHRRKKLSQLGSLLLSPPEPSNSSKSHRCRGQNSLPGPMAAPHRAQNSKLPYRSGKPAPESASAVQRAANSVPHQKTHSHQSPYPPRSEACFFPQKPVYSQKRIPPARRLPAWRRKGSRSISRC